MTESARPSAEEADSASRERDDQARPAPADIEMRLLGPDDPPRTAAMHIRQLRAGLFPALGPAFLTRWHRTFVRTPFADGVVLVARESSGEEKLAGFILVAFDPPAHTQDALRTHMVPLAVAGAWGLVRRPRLAVHFLRTRTVRYLSGFVRHRLRRRPATPEPVGESPRLAVVHAIVTDPTYRGRGLGRRLLSWAEERAAVEGVGAITLVTDRPQSRGGSILAPRHTPDASGFYEALGWQRITEHHRDGRTLVEFRREVPTVHDEGDRP